MSTIVKRYKANEIKATIRNTATTRRDATISALFYALTSGNIEFLTDVKREELAEYDTTLRVLFPVKYVKKSNGYVFNREKCVEVCSKLDIEWQSKDFDKIANILLEFYNKNKSLSQAKELTAQELQDSAKKTLERTFKKAIEAGLTVGDVEVLFQKFKKTYGGNVLLDTPKIPVVPEESTQLAATH